MTVKLGSTDKNICREQDHCGHELKNACNTHMLTASVWNTSIKNAH